MFFDFCLLKQGVSAVVKLFLQSSHFINLWELFKNSQVCPPQRGQTCAPSVVCQRSRQKYFKASTCARVKACSAEIGELFFFSLGLGFYLAAGATKTQPPKFVVSFYYRHYSTKYFPYQSALFAEIIIAAPLGFRVNLNEFNFLLSILSYFKNFLIGFDPIRNQTCTAIKPLIYFAMVRIEPYLTISFRAMFKLIRSAKQQMNMSKGPGF